MPQSAAELFVRCLEAEGVSHIFGLPGEENEDMLFALEGSKVQFVSTRHEQGAAFMADVWGRVTGRAGVCLATLGPGATNLLTGLADAALDKSPVVAITAQGSSERLHKESHQAIDIVSIFRPIAKWNISIQRPQIIPEAVRKAFKLAQAEKPGVTHLELPEDIAKEPTAGEPLMPIAVRRPGPDYKALALALELLKGARRPLIIAGNGAIRKLAAKHLSLFVAATNIPVVATFMGKGAVSDRDPHVLSTIGVRGRDYPLCAIEQADLIITVGYDVAEYDPMFWNSNTKRPIIHIDFTPAEVYATYQPTVEVVGDISATMWALQQQAATSGLPFYSSWYAPIRQAIEADLAEYAKQEGKSPTVPFVLSRLRRVLRDDDIIVSDVGAHKMWIGRNFPVYTPGSCIISNGFASMGIAVPGGLAAKLAHPTRRVVAVTGDGGFLMNSQELATAQRLRVPYTIVILNDNDYGLVTWKQQAHRQHSFGTALTNPDFVKYAESFSIQAYRPKTLVEVEQALRAAVDSNTLAIVAIDIDAAENLRLSEKLDQNLCTMLR